MQQLQRSVFPTYFPDAYTDGQAGMENRLALGTAGIGGMWRPISSGEALDVLLTALSEGIMAFDTAPAYGDAEKYLGKALDRWRGPKPYISTKVGRLKGKDATDARYDYSADGLRESLLRSLDNLNLDRIPLLFLHDPAQVPAAERERVLKTLLSFREEGLAGRIGLGGTLDIHWRSFLKKDKVDVLMEYNNLDAVNLSALHSTVPICLRENIVRYQASPLHNGLLGGNFRAFSKKRPDWISEKEVAQAARLFTIGQKYDIPFDQLALRFVLSIGEVSRVVIGAANVSELSSSIQAWKEGSLPQARFYEICNNLI
ncbi:MAG: aldo/keto reductase [Lewinellaceae bacterium]|nr:aldo/keto reductase [Lewinellaceae bacterium]